MRWRYKTVEFRSIEKSHWHKWFAWHPVCFNGLTVIERRAIVLSLPYGQDSIIWEYRDEN